MTCRGWRSPQGDIQDVPDGRSSPAYPFQELHHRRGLSAPGPAEVCSAVQQRGARHGREPLVPRCAGPWRCLARTTRLRSSQSPAPGRVGVPPTCAIPACKRGTCCMALSGRRRLPQPSRTGGRRGCCIAFRRRRTTLCCRRGTDPCCACLTACADCWASQSNICGVICITLRVGPQQLGVAEHD